MIQFFKKEIEQSVKLNIMKAPKDWSQWYKHTFHS